MAHEQNPFETVSDINRSREDRLYQAIDEYVLTPLRIIWNDVRARVGGTIILIYVLMGTVGPLITPEPRPDITRPFESPSLQYPFGTNHIGRDLLHTIIHSTPAMLEMAFAGATFAVIVGTMLGLVAGFKGGRLDMIIQTLADVILTLPGIPLTLILVVYFNPRSAWMIGLVLQVHAWGGLTRSVRSEALSVREESYVEASQALGLSTVRIAIKDLLPNIAPWILMGYMGRMKGVIFASVGLYFLGILPTTGLHWGIILNRAWAEGALLRPDLWHWLFIPIFVTASFTFGLVLFAQSTDQLFNPRVRSRHAETSESEESLPTQQ